MPKENPEPVNSEPMQLVWDLPTRIFHWGLVILITASITTGEIGSLDAMKWHFYSGYGVLTLLFFRFGWGFAGARYARFTGFLKGPGTVLRYLKNFNKQGQESSVGHNPAGGWMVMLMLGVLLLQTGTGLFATDDIFVEGPLGHLADREQQSLLTRIHHISSKCVFVLIALHLAALLAYRIVRRENLIPAMLHGKKHFQIPNVAVESQRLITAVVLIALAAVLVTLGVTRL